MTYLNSWLLDSAENTLEDFNPSSKNYKLALESLIYRFGNDQSFTICSHEKLNK